MTVPKPAIKRENHAYRGLFRRVEEDFVDCVAAECVYSLALVHTHVLEFDVSYEQIAGGEQLVLHAIRHDGLTLLPAAGRGGPGDLRLGRTDGSAMQHTVGANVFKDGLCPVVDAGR